MQKVALSKELAATTYPGRGIVIGKSKDGKKAVTAYFIMGRSANSRNRVFVEDGEGIRTQAFDPSKLEDPSLIIYAPVRVLGNKTIVTNGDQTDTIYELMDKQQTFEQALRTREFEPDAPNYTPRISGIMHIDKGEFRGINDMISSASHGDIERICMYSLMDAPMTSCGCFEVIAAMTVDMQAVVLVDRDFPGMTPVGMKFSTLAGSIGGGRQTPGFMGIGKKYITSEKFISAEGGIARIAWMPKHLKDLIKEQFQRRCEDIGMPDLWNKIADETITDDAEGLMAWMAQVEHPALTMDPLL